MSIHRCVYQQEECQMKKCQISMNVCIIVISIIEMFNKKTDYDMTIIK